MTERRRVPAMLIGTMVAATLLFGVRLALGETPAGAATPVPAPALSDDELRTANAEVQAIGGMAYTYFVGAAPDEAQVDAFLKRIGPAPTEGALEKIGVKKFTSYAFAMPPALRDLVSTTPAGRVSRKIQCKGSWLVAYVVSARYTPIPPLEQFKDSLPKLVQAGAIPAPADALRAPLVYVYQAAQVQSVEALGRLGPEVDVDTTLPNGGTMLSNAIAAGRTDLVTALLDRHANPNKCGAGVCPLTMSVYSKDAPAMLRLLLERGADANLVDPAVGAVAPALTMAVL